MIHLTPYEGRVVCIGIKKKINKYHKKLCIQWMRYPYVAESIWDHAEEYRLGRELGAWGLLHLKLYKEDKE